jgi:hypothetical protein
MLPETRGWIGGPAPWAGKIAVLVTTLDETAYPATALARLYRERADAENIYDELKNQWGWNGLPGAAAPALRAACGRLSRSARFTTQALAPSGQSRQIASNLTR